MMTIQEGWETYQKEVVHPNAGPIQLKETRMAFHGGASTVLEILAAVSEEKEYTEEAALAIIEGLSEEVVLFADELGGELNETEPA